MTSPINSYKAHFAGTQQSGFTPGRSTCDCILTLCNIVQRRQTYGCSTYVAYVDVHAAFDSVSRPALWLLLKMAGLPEKIVTLIGALCDKSVSCFRANGLQSTWFKIMSGVRYECVMSPDSFATGMHYLLERAVGIGMNGVSFGEHSYTDLDLPTTYACSQNCWIYWCRYLKP